MPVNGQIIKRIRIVKIIIDTQQLINRTKTLLEQNKVIARGLILLEKYIREKTPMGFGDQPSFESKPLPRML